MNFQICHNCFNIICITTVSAPAVTVPLPIGAMIGDTNLFLYDSEDCTRLAEVEIMIAENNVRRKRRGWEAVLLMLRYGMLM